MLGIYTQSRTRRLGQRLGTMTEASGMSYQSALGLGMRLNSGEKLAYVSSYVSMGVVRISKLGHVPSSLS